MHTQYRFMQAFAVMTLVFGAAQSRAEETKTLLTMISEWRYPDARINGATMSDGETFNKNGERTVPSTFCKTVLITKDPLDQVVAYYKKLLKQPEDVQRAAGTGDAGDKSAFSGRSVMFHEDSKGRGVGIHIIVVNTGKTSTTLVISRAEKEAETHIAWTHYERH
jgi:hypothetical protein